MKEKYIQPKPEKERPETRVEKLFGNLKEQYVEQIKMMSEIGLIELLPDSGELGICDVEGNERPMPDYDELVERMEEQVEMIERKFAQGFTELQLTPYGLSVETLAKWYRQMLADKPWETVSVTGYSEEYGYQSSFALSELPTIPGEGHLLDEIERLEEYGKLKSVNHSNDDGLTKVEKINRDITNHVGWSVNLLQPELRWLDSVKYDGSFTAGKSLGDYQAELLEPEHRDESFLTIEDILFFMIKELRFRNNIPFCDDGSFHVAVLGSQVTSTEFKAVGFYLVDEHYIQFEAGSIGQSNGSHDMSTKTGVRLE